MQEFCKRNSSKKMLKKSILVTVHSTCDQQRISPFKIAFGDGRDAIQDKTCILRANQRSD